MRIRISGPGMDARRLFAGVMGLLVMLGACRGSLAALSAAETPEAPSLSDPLPDSLLAVLPPEPHMPPLTGAALPTCPHGEVVHDLFAFRLPDARSPPSA